MTAESTDPQGAFVPIHRRFTATMSRASAWLLGGPYKTVERHPNGRQFAEDDGRDVGRAALDLKGAANNSSARTRLQTRRATLGIWLRRSGDTRTCL